MADAVEVRVQEEEEEEGWCDRVAFRALCDFLEAVFMEKVKAKKTDKLVKFLGQCRAAMPQGRCSMFPIVRLLIPKADLERGSYGIQETVLAKLYISLLKLGPNSSDAQKLLHYRAPDPTARSSKDAGDFAAVLYSVAKDRSYPGEKISVLELNRLLQDMVLQSAMRGRKAVEAILLRTFQRLSALQLKWFVRIVLKDLRLGLASGSILNAFHPDAKEYHQLNGNLRKMCQVLANPDKRLNEMEICLFSAFKPMLAETGSLDRIVQQMGNKSFYIETKYDGERMLVHFANHKFRFFSRNGHDFTDTFGADARDQGTFCQYIAQSLAPSVKSVILDGEICAFNHLNQCLCTKSVKNNIRNLRPDDPAYQQCLYLYDLVFLNGRVLCNQPYSQRLSQLRETIRREIPGRIHLTERRMATTAQEVFDALNGAIDRLEEGLVLKDPDSIYQPGARNKGGWVKVKPEYNRELIDTCDLLILGGYYSSGRRHSGLVSHFLMGVFHAEKKEFWSLCRVGSGFSNKELADLLLQLKPHFKTGTKCPSCLKFGREKPDVWINPKHSVVLEVKASEIISSHSFNTFCTLRFPRVENIRMDKKWSECMTYEELCVMRNRAEGRLAKKLPSDFQADPSCSSPSKRRRLNAGRSAALPRVAAAYQSADFSQVQVASTAHLKDKVVVVEPCPQQTDLKLKLEQIAAKWGATVEQNASRERTFCFVVTANKIRARNVLDSMAINVVKASWLLDCQLSFRPFGPADLLFATEDTLQSFKGLYDEFGCSLYRKSNLDELKYSMEQVKLLQKDLPLTWTEMADFENQHLVSDTGTWTLGMFRTCTLYFDKDEEEETKWDPLERSRYLATFYGAQTAPNLELPDVTHVVLHSSHLSRLQHICSVRAKKPAGSLFFHVVTHQWIDQCLEARQRLNERLFAPAPGPTL